jgi:L-asparaginase II
LSVDELVRPMQVWHSAADAATEVMVEVTRGELVESVHRGAAAVVSADGRLLYRIGDPWLITHMRSSAKPLQIIPLLEGGGVERFGFSEQEVAAMIASHNGEAIHVQTVQGILDKIGKTEADLACGAHYPTSKQATRAMKARGEAPSQLHNNCSGKHSGMLALAVMNDWPTEGYYRPSHPVQQAIRQAVTDISGVADEQLITAVDGCSAVEFAMPLYHMALAYARLSDAKYADFTDARRAAIATATAAMRAYPEMIGGNPDPLRIDTVLMAASNVGGIRPLISKVGAEGVHCLGLLPIAEDALPAHDTALGGGLGVAVKVADGDEGNRARNLIVIEELRQLRALDEPTWIRLRELFAVLMTNHRGILVGGVRPVFRFALAELKASSACI